MNRWIYFCAAAVALGVLSVPATGLAQDKAAVAMLQGAEQAQSLDDAALKPWHMKMAVQLYSAEGKPTEAGTIEEWWAGPNKFRRVFTTPSYTATEVKNADGFFRTTGSAMPPFLLARVLQEVIHPIQFTADSGDVLPDLRKQKTKNGDLDCIALRPHVKGLSDAPISALTTYCLRDGDSTLIGSYDMVQTSTLAASGKFQGRNIPIDLNLFISGRKLASEHIDSIGIVDGADAEFVVTKEFAAVKDDPIQARVAATGLRTVKSGPPPFSARAVQLHIMSGTIVMHIMIGADGKVQDAGFLVASDPMLLDKQILDKVRQWTYQPFAVDGRPVDAETIISFSFSIGGGPQ